MNTALDTPAPAANDVSACVPAAGQRLASLDALRGFDMMWIVGGDAVVRALGKVSDNRFTRFLDVQFTHAEWAGLHFYDLIYPLFLFVMGVSMVLSLDKALARDGRRAVLGRIARRTAVLYGLNFLYNGGFLTRWPDMRVASGVLAMIAASYLLAGLIYCFFGQRLKVMAVITAVLLLGNWALLAWVPFPDITLNRPTVEALAPKAGSHDPAAIAAVVSARVHGTYDAGHNLSNYLDFRFIPGKQMQVYYENQGLLSPLTSVTLCLAGIFAAKLLLNSSVPSRRKVLWLTVGGVAAASIGWLWSVELPVVKRLWTSSYCLVCAGYSALLLALFYQLVDAGKRQGWSRPFQWIGVNPITLYLLSGFVDFSKLALRLVGGDVKAWLENVAAGLGGVAIEAVALGLLLMIARFLYQRKIFLRV